MPNAIQQEEVKLGLESMLVWLQSPGSSRNNPLNHLWEGEGSPDSSKLEEEVRKVEYLCLFSLKTQLTPEGQTMSSKPKTLHKNSVCEQLESHDVSLKKVISCLEQ